MNNFVIWSHAVSIEQFAPGGIRRPFHKLDYSTQLLLLLLQYSTYCTNLSIYRLQIVKESPSFVFYLKSTLVPLLNGYTERDVKMFVHVSLRAHSRLKRERAMRRRRLTSACVSSFLLLVEGSCGCCCCGFLSLRWRAAPLCSFCSFLIVE